MVCVHRPVRLAIVIGRRSVRLVSARVRQFRPQRGIQQTADRPVCIIAMAVSAV